MNKSLLNLENPIFKLISETAEELNLQTFVIGGYVRDAILNRNNPKDIDVVSKGSGIDLAKKLSEKIGNPQVYIFKRFGTARINYKDLELEFVGARKESYSKDSRKPAVENGTLQDDQNRRDFTINALAISLNKNDFGALIDPFNGIQDLNDKIIRTPLDPDITYSDDPLRMMRAVRFASQLGFSIEKESFDSIKRNSERLKIVSNERTMTEFNKIMMTKKPSYGLDLLEKSGLLKLILPELTALKGVEDIQGHSHKDNFYHTLEVVDNISVNTENLWLRWAALLHDIGKAPTKKFIPPTGWTFHGHEYVGSKMTYRIFKRLKLPVGQTVKYVQKIISMSSRPIAVVDKEATDSAVRRLVFDAGDDIDDLMTLCNADITTKNPIKKEKYKNNFKIVEKRIKEVEERDRIKNWQPPITGEIIMKTFDLKPGKEVGIIKSKIREAILEGDIPNNFEDAHKYMVGLGAEMGLDAK